MHGGLVADEGKPCAGLSRQVRRMHRELDESKNPLLAFGSLSGSMIESGAFERMTELRLLHVAAHYRGTGGFLPLKDPFGAEFLHARTETRMRIWRADSDDRVDLVMDVDPPGPE